MRRRRKATSVVTGRRYSQALAMAHAMPQVSGVDHRWVRVGDMNFHVAEAGEGDPILLLHGWPQHWYCWRLVIPKLAESHRVIAIDLRGFGWSDIAWEGFEKENMADDIAGVLEELDLDRVKLVGHDWGAWLGYLLAMRRPELIERLVAVSAPPPFAPRSFRALATVPRFRYYAALASPFAINLISKRRYVARKVRMWAADRANLKRNVQKLYDRDLRATTRARAAMLLYRTFLLRELGPVLAGRYRGRRIEVPTLIMHGDRDPILPPVLYEGHERFFEALRVESVPGAGHLLPEERPALVAERALDFFSATDHVSPEPQPA